VQKFLTEANKAAKIAATARLNEERKQQGNLLNAARANLTRTTTEVGPHHHQQQQQPWRQRQMQQQQQQRQMQMQVQHSV
jgi:hypothetical protein